MNWFGMLEAVTKDLVFTISLKRSTQNLQLSTSWARPITPSFGGKADYMCSQRVFRLLTQLRHWLQGFGATQHERRASYRDV